MFGELARGYARKRDKGGYGIEPWLWNFGWQFETQFVNSGYSQALFECLLNVAGVEKGMFLPSMTLFIGYRHNKHGLEAGVGPIFSIINVASAQLPREDGTKQTIYFPSPKGDPVLTTGLVVAAGKTFKSGRMNLPVTLYAIPRNSGANVGLSCGFNVKRKPKQPAGSREAASWLLSAN